MVASSSLSVALTVLVITVSLTNGFLFRSDAIVSSNGREIDEECLAKADEGSCQFYTCFERRLPCGRDWYILQKGQFYCNKIQGMMDEFSEDAQEFLRESQTCLTQSLKDVYREDMVSCHDLEHQAVGAISRCYLDNAFCSRLRGNYAQFFRIYEMNDLFSSGSRKVWEQILRLAAECGEDALQSITADATSTLTDGARDLMSSMRDRLSSIFSFKKK